MADASTSTPSAAAAAAVAFVDEEYGRAVELYGEALTADPSNPTLLAARAQAHLKLGNWLEAAGDAGRAAELEPGLVKAWARKGTALFHLEEFEAAAAAFARVLAADPGNADATVWARKCAAELEEEAANGGGGAATAATTAPAPPPPPPPPAALPIQWFQTADKVEVAVLVKRLTPDRVRVEIGGGRLVVEVKAAPGSSTPTLPPLDLALARPVNPSKCAWEILSTKVEVRLAKAEPGMWRSLGADGSFPAPGLLAVGGGGEGGAVVGAAVPAPSPAPPRPSSKEPSPPRGTYPSSSSKPKDWNALERAVAEEEAAAAPEGEEALSHLFRTLYKDADDDTRRAMVKSYQESGGTVLSTSWADVGKGEVKMTAPEGMEVKKFEY